MIGLDLIHSFLTIRYIRKAQSDRHGGHKNVNKTRFLFIYLFIYLFFFLSKIFINNFHKTKIYILK